LRSLELELSLHHLLEQLDLALQGRKQIARASSGAGHG
jgi:hypothetical protein